jgi:hypothetical protein
MCANELNEFYIDHSSLLSGVVATLCCKTLEQSPALSHLPALEVTTLLLSNPQSLIRVSEAPSGFAGFHGLSSQLLDSLGPIVSYKKPGDANAHNAKRRVIQWGRENHSRVREIRDLIVQTPSFDEWFDWTVRNTWGEQVSTYGELFNRDFLPVIARVLNCPPGDLTHIWTLSRDLVRVTDWSKRPPGEDAQLATEAYLVAALLRGRYHDDIARAEVRTVLHHPWRERILPSRQVTAHITPNNTLRYVALAILKASYQEKSVGGRVALWAENVLAMRRALVKQLVDLGHKEHDDIAQEAARLAIARARLRCYSSKKVKVFDFSKSISIGVVFFALSEWLHLPREFFVLLAASTPFVFESLGKNFGERASHLLSGRQRRRLVQPWPPGRMIGRWSAGGD